MHVYHHLDIPSKPMHRRCKKFHDKKKWKFNATSTIPIAHTVYRGSSSKGRYCNSGCTWDMSKEKTVNVTPGNRVKGRIKDLGKLAKPSRKEALLRKE